jgi:hypothetical protein
VIYCDAPVYKAHAYVTAELFYDRKKQLSRQLIFDKSIKRLWAIRKYELAKDILINNCVTQFYIKRTITGSLAIIIIVGNNEIIDNQKYTSNAGNFDCHADAAVGFEVHRLMEHIPGFTRSHWMLPSCKCLHCIAVVAAMVDEIGQKHKTIPQNYF